jgi:hypothetical protein
VLIPGGGVRDGGVLPPWVIARMDRAIEVGGTSYLVPLNAGTPHRPPPLEDGFPITEARAGARYLLQQGVDSARLLIEECSLDSIGNAYFSLVVHAIPHGFRRILVITSEFHMPRIEAIFRWVYSLPGPGEPCTVDVEEVPNVGIDEQSLQAREAKECAGLKDFLLLQNRIDSLRTLHHWLFTEHAASASPPRPRPAMSVIWGPISNG